MSKPLILLSTLVSLSLFSCAGGNDKPAGQPQNQTPAEPDYSPLSSATHVGALAFDDGLSQKQRGAFVAALDYLEKTEILNADTDLLNMMNIRRGDASTLRSWLEDRVQFILPANANLEAKFPVVDTNYTSYENPGEVPADFPKGDGKIGPKGLDDTSASVVMSNIGAAVYLTGKVHNRLYGFKSDGAAGLVHVTSPRTGILRAGDGLFLVPSRFQNAVKVFHLTTLIHESRHSDGNRTTTGFLHAVCPTGDYKGELACDHNTNGPYIIEALATKALMNNCPECSAGDHKVIEILYADVNQRQIVDATLKKWDDAPEGRR